ncbi:hypothetical protein ABRP83_13585 [Pectobacterium brasiliense]
MAQLFNIAAHSGDLVAIPQVADTIVRLVAAFAYTPSKRCR